MNKRPLISKGEARRLVERYGSPLYVYRKRAVIAAYRALELALGNSKIFYACKANTNHEILKALNKVGACVETVSPGEIKAAQKAGFKPKRISFTCSNIPREELLAVMKTGVRVHLDSLNQMRWWGEAVGGARSHATGVSGEARPCSKISIRINRGFGAGHHSHVITGGVGSKFGIHYTQLDEAKRIGKKYKLTIAGLHQHIGSNILDSKTFARATRLLLKSAREFPQLEFLDFGGGFGIPYRPEESALDIRALGMRMTELFSGFSRTFGKPLEFSVEPGRYIVAPSGALLARVVDIKKTPAHTFVGVNTGFNHLIRTAMYGSYHHIFNLSNPNGRLIKTTVAGYVCESGDVFCKDRPIPEAKIGDLLLLADAGAYGYVMSSNYNLRDKPREIVI